MQVELGGVVNKACPHVVISGTSRGTVSLAGWRPGTVSVIVGGRSTWIPWQPHLLPSFRAPCHGAEWRLLLPPPRLPHIDIVRPLQL